MKLPRFRDKNGQDTIAIERILYLSAGGNYTVFHLKEGEKIVTSLSLSSYAPLLEQHGFLRVHKSYLLNTDYLRECLNIRNHFLILPDGEKIEIARRRRSALRQQSRLQRIE
ncbi:LytR/AlgR family response regulator transcription factor [Runella sp.]|uniref:LytR/AlgR family response regulator transcription factor n=1 Tax=Runella sp. TaxID=1960881 RepID=UPI003D1158D8